MTTDEQISQDLAVVGRASRERPIALETTLRRVGAVADGKPANRSASTSTDTFALHVANVYVQRAARAAAGGAAVACTALLIIYTCLNSLIDWHGPGLLADLAWTSKLWIALSALFIIAWVQMIAARIAWRRCLRLVASGDLEAVRQRARRLIGVSTVAALTGAMTFVLFFGMMQITIGGGGLGELFDAGPVWPSLQLILARWTIVLLTLAIAGTVVAAIVVARRAASGGSSRAAKSAPRLIVSGIALLAVTIIVGLRYDVGPSFVMVVGGMPSMWFRAVLTATGTTGLFLIASALMRVIVAREDAELADSNAS